MMQLLNKKRKLIGNKGFSLVELIIVIAIMAVLVAILAPQYLRYVENSRVSSDNAAAAEILNATKIAVANETVYNALVGDETITWTGSNDTLTFAGTGAATLQTEVLSSLGLANTTLDAKAKTHATQSYVLSITIVSGQPTVAVTDWS